jgi:hypothetical protein
VPAEVDVSPAGPQTWPLLEQLWQLYRHDLSEFRGSMPGPDGRFDTDKLSPYLGDDPDRAAFVLYLVRSPSGFALVRGLSGATRVMSEFFVVRAPRRVAPGPRRKSEAGASRRICLQIELPATPA